MASLENHRSQSATKILVVAKSGVGKTGALASLVDAGYELGILDFDNGLDPLVGYIKDPSKMANVSYHTLTDTYGQDNVSKKPIPKIANAFTRSLELMNKWVDKDDEGNITRDWGNISTWGPNRVLVADTLTFAGKAAMNWVMSYNGKLGKHPEIQHWGEAMNHLENLLALWNSDALKCNLIVNTHIEEGAGPGGVSELFPSALGSKLPPKVGGYFNNMISLKKQGESAVFRTQKDGQLGLKTARALPPEIPIGNGLAEIFEYLQGKKIYKPAGK